MIRGEELDNMTKCYDERYPLWLISSGRDFRSKCFNTCDVMYALYLLFKESQVIPTFVKIRCKFISTLFKSLVRETNATKSKS